MLALRENINAEKVEMRHFVEALKKVYPSITEDMVKSYRAWAERLRHYLQRGKSPMLSFV
jgi:transitional endoplasmic reticulum ATPase